MYISLFHGQLNISCAALDGCVDIITLTLCIFACVNYSVSSPGVWLQKAHEVDHQSGSRGNPEYVDRVKLLEKEVNYYKDEVSKSQTEVERLLDILREVETEKNDKDKKIAELER